MRIKIDGENEVFIIADQTGLKFYNIAPLTEIARIDAGSLVTASNVGRTNMLAIVGGGERPRFSQNTLVVYDAAKGEPAMDITFDSPVIETIMTKDTLIAIQINGASVYSIPDGRLLLQARTNKNSRGLASFRAHKLAIPGQKTGSVHIYDVLPLREKKISSPAIPIYAHQGQIAQIELSRCGSKLATASDKGTLIRVFDTVSKARLFEFRRGADPAAIYSIVFSKDWSFLAVTSDKGTLHLFALRDKLLNRKSALSSVIGGNYTDSMWSLATGPIPEERITHVAFIGSNRLVCVSVDGSIHFYHFSPEGAINRTEVRHLDELEMSSENW